MINWIKRIFWGYILLGLIVVALWCSERKLESLNQFFQMMIIGPWLLLILIGFGILEIIKGVL